VSYTSTKRGLLVQNYITCDCGRYIMTTIACSIQLNQSYSGI